MFSVVVDLSVWVVLVWSRVGEDGEISVVAREVVPSDSLSRPGSISLGGRCLIFRQTDHCLRCAPYTSPRL